jgi:hypothetical protein
MPTQIQLPQLLKQLCFELPLLMLPESPLIASLVGPGPNPPNPIIMLSLWLYIAPNLFPLRLDLIGSSHCIFKIVERRLFKFFTSYLNQFPLILLLPAQQEMHKVKISHEHKARKQSRAISLVLQLLDLIYH